MSVRATLGHDHKQLLYASAARTATPTALVFSNHTARGVLIYLNFTAFTASPALTPSIQWSPDGGTTWVSYAAFTAITDTEIATPPTTFTYLLYPGILASSDGALSESVNLPLPRMWRFRIAHGDTDSVTYSARAHLL